VDNGARKKKLDCEPERIYVDPGFEEHKNVCVIVGIDGLVHCTKVSTTLQAPVPLAAERFTPSTFVAMNPAAQVPAAHGEVCLSMSALA
jgi:hypothetical protein